MNSYNLFNNLFSRKKRQTSLVHFSRLVVLQISLRLFAEKKQLFMDSVLFSGTADTGKCLGSVVKQIAVAM